MLTFTYRVAATGSGPDGMEIDGISLGSSRVNGAATTALMPRAFSRGLRSALTNLQLGRGSLAALVVFGLLAGLGRGWFTRPDDLLSEHAD